MRVKNSFKRGEFVLIFCIDILISLKGKKGSKQWGNFVCLYIYPHHFFNHYFKITLFFQKIEGKESVGE